MKNTILFVVALFLTAHVTLADTFISSVDGVRYETLLKPEAVHKTGGEFGYEVAKNHTYASEPLGISLAMAIAKAEPEAKRILGEGYTAKDPRWILKSAERMEYYTHEEGHPERQGYYYRMSYSTRGGAYSSEEFKGPHGNLQIIVLLDGTVLPVTKVVEEGK